MLSETSSAVSLTSYLSVCQPHGTFQEHNEFCSYIERTDSIFSESLRSVSTEGSLQRVVILYSDKRVIHVVCL